MENVEIVRRLLKLFNESGIQAVAASDFIDPEVEFCEPPEQPAPRILRGRNAALEAFAAFDDTWEEHRTQPQEIRALDDDRVLVVSTEYLRGRDRLEFEEPFWGIYTVRQDKIVRYEAFWTQERALEVAGLSEKAMAEEDVERVLDRMFDAVKEEDLDAFVALHDPNVKLTPLILDIEGGGYTGHEGVRRFWSEIHDAFPDWHWEVEGVRVFDGGALATVRICGHGEGSGVTIDQRAWQVVKLQQGKIIWWRIFRSENEAIEAAGLRE